jgi:glycosyltransferase 2 family protein
LTLLGVAVSGGLLAVAVVRLDWSRVLGALGDARLLPWVPAAVAAYLAGHGLRGVRCRLLLRDAGVSLATATNMVVVGYAVNNILPARAGELARAGMITDRTGLPFASALTVTFVERLLDGLAIIGLLFVGALSTRLPQWLSWTVWPVLGVFAVATVVVALLVAYPDVFRAFTARLSARFGPRLQGRLVRLVAQITTGVAVLGQPGVALRLSALSAAIWLCESGMFLALLPALGLPASLSWAFVVMGVTNLGVLAPSTPGFVGTFHFFVITALHALGVAEEPAAAYAVVVHATFYVPITIWGLGALMVYGVEFARLRTLSRVAHQLPPVGAADDLRGATAGAALVVETLPAIGARPPRRGTLLEVMVRAFMVSGADRLERLPPAQREQVTSDVVAFVAGQVAALPNRLRMLFRVGVIGFGVAVRLRHPRGLAALPPARQAAVVQAWAFGRWAQPRKLFRLIRSTTLLAFYDHPLIAGGMAAGPDVMSVGLPHRVSS